MALQKGDAATTGEWANQHQWNDLNKCVKCAVEVADILPCLGNKIKPCLPYFRICQCLMEANTVKVRSKYHLLTSYSCKENVVLNNFSPWWAIHKGCPDIRAWVGGGGQTKVDRGRGWWQIKVWQIHKYFQKENSF